MSNNTQQAKQTVFVTGCSSGIGLCIAKKLQHSPFRVIASCRKQEDVDRLNSEGIETILLDLANEKSVEAGAEKLGELTSHRIFGLVNNGAYGQPGAVIDLDREVLRKQFETNVFGTQQLTNLLLPMMLPYQEGRIIQISSILGFICLKFRGAYNASKYALEGLTDTMRLEHAQSGVQFSLIEPGPITSDFRINAYAMFNKHIDTENSVFKASYADVEKRLKESERARFTLPADAVHDAVWHALTHPKAKIRYRVTTPTKIMMILKRLLPDRTMDAFLLANSDK
ncbi:MAG: SDR family NAD(P)-dependent oxidoreductase [Acidiferrobacterales bacterium]|nr:SDR family NAD(P)-dependent oxidoreductase [Acidiferrobacterales bacterium]